MIKEKLIDSLRYFTPLSLLFIVVFMALRVYEYFFIRSRAGVTPSIVFSGWPYDLLFLLSVCCVAGMLFVTLRFFYPKLALVFCAVFFVLMMLINMALVEYFQTTLVPLSADLYGYTLRDIQLTAGASARLTVLQLVRFLLFPALFLAGVYWLNRNRMDKKVSAVAAMAFGGAMMLSWFFPHRPPADNYEHDIDRYMAVNKTEYFLSNSFRYFVRKEPAPAFDPAVYPFLRDIKYTDVLGRYFNGSPEPPNIVIIIVEGLGRDFTGPDAEYGGFTPFLDSLAQKSLSWRNALSNAGRTFGVLPSVLGSLPYGESSILQYGKEMPDHRTLISLLKPYGYTASFFYGGHPGFDNIDIFLEHQGVDFLLSEHNFPPGYVKMEGNDQGFSWGYADRDVFQEGLKSAKKQSGSSHIDIYLTLSTHEPFVVPEKKFETLFDKIIDSSPWSDSRKEIYKANRNIFSTLLYTDDAIRQLIAGYSKHPDFNRTIFIITGDHRLIPIPSDNRISRYHVPLILYSPMLKEAASFSSLAAHSSITPTLLSWLTSQYGMQFPPQMPFISDELRTDQSFSSDLDMALARYKNGILDYVEGEYFLSEERLFRILPGMKLDPINDGELKDRLTRKLNDFTARGIFACEHNRIDKAPRSYKLFSLGKDEMKYIRGHGFDNLTPDEQFTRASGLAFNKQYRESRIVLRNLLNAHPSYYDGYILLARTFAWEGQYDTARAYLQRVKRRAPFYGDVYVAMTDVEYWDGKHDSALAVVLEGLKADSGNHDLQARYARALWMTGKEKEARAVAEDILKKSPAHELAKDLLHKIQ